MSAQHPLITQLVSALRLARGYMSDAVEYEMPCAKKDAALVDEAIAAASGDPLLAAQPIVVTEGRPKPDSSPQFAGLDRLLTFYDVTNVSDLMAEMERHILKLQEKNRQLDPRVERFQPVPRA